LKSIGDTPLESAAAPAAAQHVTKNHTMCRMASTALRGL
jgi:hypothetical protein